MKFTKWLPIALVLMLVLAGGFGCAKKTVSSTPAEPAKAEAGGKTFAPSTYGTKAPSSMDSGDVGDAAMKEKEAARALAQAKAEVTGNKIYFDFDKYDLKPEARDVLKAKAAVLKKYASLRIIVEGHCDERGTEEYNLALGERRARAAYEFLVLLGVKASQLEIVSYGEERADATGHNEAAWAKNRRCEFRFIQ